LCIFLHFQCYKEVPVPISKKFYYNFATIFS
jgi:hypothetical protein